MSSGPPESPADARESARDLRRWAMDIALPFWASTGWDSNLGAFHERLHPDGTPDVRAARRVRVQARQIYVYAHASVLGWHDGIDVALRAVESLLRHYRSPDGAPGFVHTLTPDGRIENPLRDTYDHAFLLLALAWVARASGDAQIRALLDEVLAFIDEHLAAGDGSFHEGVPRSEPRRQNPHMHLFEAMLALHETVAHPQALARAANLRALLIGTFIDAETRTLTEYFDTDWKPRPGPRIVEPGHHAEWSWLLRRRARFVATDNTAGHLRVTASRFADPRFGLLPDEVAPDGTVLRPTHRCWPQAEMAKAWLAEHECGTPDAAAEAARMLTNLSTRYLRGPLPGTWVDKLDAAAAPIADFVPASTFYHLFSAIAEADRVFGQP